MLLDKRFHLLKNTSAKNGEGKISILNIKIRNKQADWLVYIIILRTLFRVEAMEEKIQRNVKSTLAIIEIDHRSKQITKEIE